MEEGGEGGEGEQRKRMIAGRHVGWIAGKFLFSAHPRSTVPLYIVENK